MKYFFCAFPLLVAFNLSLEGAEIGVIKPTQLLTDFNAVKKSSSLRFSWQIKAEGRAQRQEKYRIFVADSEKKLETASRLLWDSGENKSSQSLFVDYKGPPLVVGKNYFWKVQLKSPSQEVGNWSNPQKFTFRNSSTVSSKRERKVSARPIASFHSSDEALNKVFALSKKTQANVLKDPAVFEPGGLPWGAHLQLSARGFAFQADLTDYYRSVSREFIAEIGHDKMIPSVIGESEDKLPSPGFSEAGIIIPYVLWQLTGDRTIIQSSFDAAVTHVGLMQKNDPNYEGKAFGKHRGDLGHLDDPTSAEFLSLCHLALNCRILGESASAIGHTPFSIQHRDWFGRIYKAFPKSFLDEDGKLIEKSQTAQILALRLGLLPEESKKKISAELAERLKREGLTCGIFGKSSVLPVLSWTNHHELAIDLAKSISSEDSEICPIIAASISEWSLGFLAGFGHPAPGFQVCQVAPFIPDNGSISEVKASHETPYGRLAIHWRKNETSLYAKVTIPPNTTGTVILPCQKEDILTEGGISLQQTRGCQLIRETGNRKEIIAQSGTYTFEITSAKPQ